MRDFSVCQILLVSLQRYVTNNGVKVFGSFFAYCYHGSVGFWYAPFFVAKYRQCFADFFGLVACIASTGAARDSCQRN